MDALEKSYRCVQFIIYKCTSKWDLKSKNNFKNPYYVGGVTPVDVCKMIRLHIKWLLVTVFQPSCFLWPTEDVS